MERNGNYSMARGSPWVQKLREQEVQFGDRNTRFFHAQTVVRRKRNKIKVFFFLLDGSWTTYTLVMQDEAMNYFTKIFTNTENVNTPALVFDSEKLISNQCADMLVGEVTKGEVWNALKYMKSLNL